MNNLTNKNLNELFIGDSKYYDSAVIDYANDINLYHEEIENIKNLDDFTKYLNTMDIDPEDERLYDEIIEDLWNQIEYYRS